MSRKRNYVFTINNYTAEDLTACEKVECSYIVYGKEVGTEGTPHLQGYIEFENGKSMKSIVKLLGGRCHVEARKGNAKQASTYCKKDGDFTERGEISCQGSRSDLDELAEIVKTKGVEAVVEEMPAMIIKYAKGIERLAELSLKPRSTKPRVVWLWGNAGVGKSKVAFDAEGKSIYSWNQTKWWNGYRQQSRLVIDDMHHNSESDSEFRYLLKILDRYPMQVETKGGMVHLNSEEIYITCEFPPDHFYDLGTNKYNQLVRRIDEIHELTFDDTDAEFDVYDEAGF